MGTQCGSGRPAGLPGPDPSWASAPRRPDGSQARRASLAASPSAASGRPLPGSRAGREKQPGAQRPRARRGHERRRGVERTAARAASTLPPESGVEHSASASRANEEDSHGNSTTYLRARNDRACPSARGPAAAQTRGRAGVGRRLGLRDLHPEGHHSSPRPGTRQAAGRRRWSLSGGHLPYCVGTRRGTCASATLCTFTSF